MAYERERTIVQTRYRYGTVLFYLFLVGAGFWGISGKYDPVSPNAVRPLEIIVGAFVMVLFSSFRYQLTTKQLITTFLGFTVRRTFPNDIRQIVLIQPSKGSKAGLLFVENTCERYDSKQISAQEFRIKHPISSIAIYTYEEHIEQLIHQVEAYWGPIERQN